MRGYYGTACLDGPDRLSLLLVCVCVCLNVRCVRVMGENERGGENFVCETVNPPLTQTFRTADVIL